MATAMVHRAPLVQILTFILAICSSKLLNSLALSFPEEIGKPQLIHIYYVIKLGNIHQCDFI